MGFPLSDSECFDPKELCTESSKKLKAGGGGAHHQAGTKPRGGHPAPQVLLLINLNNPQLTCVKNLNHLFPELKDFFYLRTAMWTESSEDKQIWNNPLNDKPATILISDHSGCLLL